VSASSASLATAEAPTTQAHWTRHSQPRSFSPGKWVAPSHSPSTSAPISRRPSPSHSHATSTNDHDRHSSPLLAQRSGKWATRATGTPSPSSTPVSSGYERPPPKQSPDSSSSLGKWARLPTPTASTSTSRRLDTPVGARTRPSHQSVVSDDRWARQGPPFQSTATRTFDRSSPPHTAANAQRNASGEHDLRGKKQTGARFAGPGAVAITREVDSTRQGGRGGRDAYKTRGSLKDRIYENVAIGGHSRAHGTNRPAGRQYKVKEVEATPLDVYIPSVCSVGNLAKLLNVRLGMSVT
jgi:hypothetical protein